MKSMLLDHRRGSERGSSKGQDIHLNVGKENLSGWMVQKRAARTWRSGSRIRIDCHEALKGYVLNDARISVMIETISRELKACCQ